MDLDEYLDQALGAGPGSPLYKAGPVSVHFAGIVGDTSQATPLIATAFWQGFIHSDAFDPLKNYTEVAYQWRGGEWPTPPPGHPVVTVVCHGQASQPRYALVIFDPAAHDDLKLRATVSAAQLRAGWAAFSKGFGLQRFIGQRGVLGELTREGMALAVEANAAEDFYILIMRPTSLGSPDTVGEGGQDDDAEDYNEESGGATVATSAVPAHAMCTSNDVSGTAGVLAKNAGGVTGATIAAHTLNPKASQARIGSAIGRVITRDEITDSCFVAVEPPPKARPVRGPLRGLLPRPFEDVTFDGNSSGPTQTKIIGWTPELPFSIPRCQSRVTTKPVTNPGDSGAALITKDRDVVGFAFTRTGFGQPLEFSAWIWAESVFDVHLLS